MLAPEAVFIYCLYVMFIPTCDISPQGYIHLFYSFFIYSVYTHM